MSQRKGLESPVIIELPPEQYNQLHDVIHELINGNVPKQKGPVLSLLGKVVIRRINPETHVIAEEMPSGANAPTPPQMRPKPPLRRR